jgi:hypothetical protein
MSTNDNYVKTTLTVVGLVLQICTCKVSAVAPNYVETCGNNAVITDEIRNLAAGPLFTVTRYEGMDINGYTFYTMTQDKKSIYQNSGVRVRAVVDDSHDDYDDTDSDTYYGQIEEIWELDYVGLKMTLFRCRWVTNGKRAVQGQIWLC